MQLQAGGSVRRRMKELRRHQNAPLLQRCQEFAAQQREAIGYTICSVETRTARMRRCVPPATPAPSRSLEVLRIDFTKPDKTMNNGICYIEHTLTFCNTGRRITAISL